MRDLVAGLVAVGLLGAAASLATTLRGYRRRRERARDSERALGRSIIAEVPDRRRSRARHRRRCTRFYYGERSIDKDLITAVRVLINGSPIASYVSRRYAREGALQATSFEDRPEGIARDRWDVAIETVTGTTLVECGAIRERVSQELARTIFDRSNAISNGAMTPRTLTAARLPFGFCRARAMIRRPGEDEQQIRQAVHIAHEHGIDRRIERDDAPLGAAADGARHVQRGAGRRSTRQDEAAQRRQLRLETIDQLLRGARRRRSPITAFVTRAASFSPGSASCAPSANRSRWMLHDRVAERRVEVRRARQPEPGVQLRRRRRTRRPAHRLF